MSKCLSDRVLVVSDTGSHAALLALRYGDMQTVNYAFDKIMVNMERAVLEPNQAPEAFTKTVLPCSHWPYLLGKGKEMAGLLSLLRMDWQSAEATCDLATADTDKNVWFAPRGQSNSAYFFVNMDYMCWSAKLNYALCAPDGAVPREDVVRALTSLTPELLSEYSLQSKGLEGSSDSSLAMISMGFSAHLIAALCAEKYGQLDQALAFVTVIHEVDPVRGSDHKPSAHILGNCVKGRVLQQLGKTVEAAAAFEAAVAQGEKVGLLLLVAFALRDLKLFILDGMGHGEHGSKRLGAVLRCLKDPAEMFTPLLGGLDAGELMSLPPPDVSYHVAYTKAEGSVTASLRKELDGLRLKDLRKKAKELGVDEDTLEDALDADDPKTAVIALIINASGAAGDTASQVAQKEAALLSELQGLRLKQLRKRARDAGVDGELLEDTTEADDPKAAVIALLIMTQSKLPPADDGQAALRTELEGLRLKELRKRAKDAGVDADDLEDTTESDDPKAAVIQLLLAHGSLGSKAVADDRPHFGTGKQQAQCNNDKKSASRKGLLPPNKHAMISYQWDDQDRVISARETMTKLGVPCWMDIDGGMQQDIYESMAAGVENAACVVCFLSQKYQDSENCKLELKFAKQSGVPIVPVMVEDTQGWRPSGWLGIVVAGALWTSLRNESEMDNSIRSLVEQIKGAVPRPTGGVPDDEEHDKEDEVVGAAAGAEIRAELERLRKVTEAKAVIMGTFTFNRDAPAEVDVGVPELPADFRPTAEIRTLQQNLLNSTTQLKVGFWGMGGIGKTVTGAALVRDADVRDHFDQIVWLPLGQTPVLEKLQSSALEQLIGKPMDLNLSEEERHAALRGAFKDKRVLLALDDLWEEEHSTPLNFVDEMCGSRVLISTRIRHLLSDAFSVEIGKPSVGDSISILMGAAELSDMGDAPAEATEIVELCGRLPLALVMAGKLILELEVGDNWDGITSILRDELRGDEQAASREQAVIRASLAGLKGSERDKAGARQLFKLFGLVPEDTACPLECLQMMYDAVYATTKGTSVLHIRKWLKLLIDRSLVLGTVDRASLHDLVLDFTIGMHSKAELIAAHRRVVEAFRTNRPTNAAGTSEWAPINRDDPVMAYLLDECAHHVRSSRDVSDASSDAVLLSWLTDQPPDVLHRSVGFELGEAALVQAAKSSEAAGDMWSASCRWTCAAAVVDQLQGPVASVPLLHSAADALAQARRKPGVPQLSLQQMDQLELCFLPDLCISDFGAVAEKQPRIRYLFTCVAGKARPDRSAYLLFIGGVIPAYISGDLEACKEALGRFFSFLAREGCERAPDPAMRELCSVFLVSIVGMICETYPVDFDWSVFGKDGELLRQGIYAYDYDKHHVKLYTDFNNDFFNATPGGHGALLAMRFGDMTAWHYAMEKVVSNMKRIVAEPNQMPEVLSLMWSVCGYWPYILGRGHDMATMMSDMEMDWYIVEAKCDAFTDDVGRNVYFAPRGQANSGPFMVNMDAICWTAKLNYILSAPDGAVPREDVVRALASLTPELLSEYLLKSDVIGGTSDSFILQCHGLSPHLLAALVAEKYDQLEQALAFVAVIHDGDPVRGGDHKASSHILGNCVKGRVLQRQHQTAEAAAAFEAAVDQAEKVRMPLLAVFALRDLKLLVLDELANGEQGSKRLGAVLRGLKDPAEMFTPLLDGLDACELVALPPSDAAYMYTVVYESEDPAVRELHGELSAMKRSALRKRASGAGIDEDVLEAAADGDDEKNDLIGLLLAAPAPELKAKPSQPRPNNTTASSKVPAKVATSSSRAVKAVARAAPVRAKAAAKKPALRSAAALAATAQVRLCVQPSDSFSAASRDVHVSASVATIGALITAVGQAVGANVTEVLIWDDDFEEYAAPADPIGDVVRDGLKVKLTVG